MNDEKDISISRSVGRFLGHIWGATTKPVEKDDTENDQPETVERVVIDQQTQETQSELDGKKVILRRTTIDEIELKESADSKQEE